jgi:hypothetical protein
MHATSHMVTTLCCDYINHRQVYTRNEMHLLHCYYDDPPNANSISISLKAWIGPIPRYAILSHRWASDPDDEVSFEDMTLRPDATTNKRGYQKLRNCCAQALTDGYNWVWIDTCCIDKKSSAELSEAINSMFVWYTKSDVCYAYLEDVGFADYKLALPKSSWFKRGWTLQELIAPAELQFFSKDWQKIGSKRRLASALSRITRVNKSVLKEGLHTYKASVAEKMSWAAKRETTRIEDRAYSLMGIFGVNMPTLYGEGSRAFTRLQNEIIKISSDHTIFTWQRKSLTAGLLAHSPDEFEHSGTWRSMDYQIFMNTFGITTAKPDFAPTNFGMHIQLPLAQIPDHNGYYLAFLSCTESPDIPFHNLRWLKSRDGEYTTQDWSNARLPLIFLRQVPGGLTRQFTRTSLQQTMIGYGRPADHTCTLEPIWISLEEDITPLLWRAYGRELPPPLEMPIRKTQAEDLVTVVMERSHHYVQILSAYPPAAFSDGNELTLRITENAADSLRIMIVQNERGKDSMAVAFFLLGSELCLACVRISAREEAKDVYDRFLTKRPTIVGFLSTPFHNPVESWMYHGGFVISLEWINVEALNYVFTIGPGERDFGNHIGGNVCSNKATQINVSIKVSPEFFILQRHGDEDSMWIIKNLLIHSVPVVPAPRHMRVVNNKALRTGIQINCWPGFGHKEESFLHDSIPDEEYDEEESESDDDLNEADNCEDDGNLYEHDD